ncbi:MAG: hypothetical protein NTV39_04485 [Candidatus Saccharibacteria bacterium]|nr:hypothetical protein [Candidatus Saccharibacteria bacterium]
MENILVILGNYVVILVSILVFVSPFYYLYKRKSHGSIRTHGLNREIESFFNDKQTNYLVFFWAMSEALFWFIIPELLLLLVIFMRTRRRRELLYYDIAGTIAGTVLAFVINLPAHLIEKLPFVQPAMVQQCIAWFDKSGIFALFYQPFSGVPYKVFAYLGPNLHILIIVFIVAAVAVNVARYFVIYLLSNKLYSFFHKFVYHHYVAIFLVVVFIFSVSLLQVYHAFDGVIIKGISVQDTTLVQNVHTG